MAVAALAWGWGLEASLPWCGPLFRRLIQEVAPDAPKWEGPLFWGRPNVYATETEELMEHLRTYVAPEPVLANFGISDSIEA